MGYCLGLGNKETSICPTSISQGWLFYTKFAIVADKVFEHFLVWQTQEAWKLSTGKVEILCKIEQNGEKKWQTERLQWQNRFMP